MTAPSNKAAGKVRVVARIRPLSSKELKNGSKDILKTLVDNNQNSLLQMEDSRWFALDYCSNNTPQSQFYNESGADDIIEQLFQGFNGTILAYGQTGSGKTYSMGTATSSSELTESDGIIPRAIRDVYQLIDSVCDQNATVQLSYLELYNEEIRDLLVETKSKTTKPTPLKIRQRLHGEVYVSGLTEAPVESPAHIAQLLATANTRRQVAATSMNATSSRSHAICVLRITGMRQDQKFTSKLTLVDLAGSERLKRTHATGSRATEGININKSLLILGQVVSALSNPKSKRKPPYRDSKLTRLLQDSLGGNSQTLMIACVSPSSDSKDESINTLRYASAARNIQNTATQNMVQHISQEEALQLRRENQLLRTEVRELQQLVQNLGVQAPPVEADGVETDGAETPAVSDNEEIQQLKQQLEAARVEAKKTHELPELRRQVEEYKTQLQQSEALQNENEELQREILEARQDAESSRMAATYLSSIVDSLKELKQDEIDVKNLELRQLEKEQNWIVFLNVMLENYKFQVQHLAKEFESKVVVAINRLEFVEPDPLKKSRRSSLWRKQEEALPWDMATIFFHSKLKEMEVNLQDEVNSLHDVRDSLGNECERLRQIIGAKRLESSAMGHGDNELVQQLTEMLLGGGNGSDTKQSEAVSEEEKKQDSMTDEPRTTDGTTGDVSETIMEVSMETDDEEVGRNEIPASNTI